MGVFSFLKTIIRLAIEAFVLILLITFIPGLPPDVNISKSWKVEKINLEDKFSLNNKLDGIEILYKDQVHGPESFTDDHDFVYTSLHLGDIVKLVGKHIVPVVKFGKPCKGVYQEEICGRPLGLTFGKDGYLYAADAYYGIFRVNVKTGEKVKLISMDEEIDGRKPKLPNSLVVACNGDIYWTDSDTNFSLQDIVYSLLGDGSGRLIHYSAKTGKNEVLLDNLHFANGVKLSHNEDYLLVSETNKNRIHRIYLKGPKKSVNEIFIDHLPGMPDNIQTDGSSGFIVGIVQDVHSKNPSIAQVFSQFPNIRKFLVRSFGLIELAFKTIDKIYPNEFTQKGIHFVGHSEPFAAIPGKTAILHISENGEVLDCLWGNSKIVGKFSEGHIVKDHLYLGSPYNKHLGRISLSKIGWEHLRQKTDYLSATRHRCLNINKIETTVDKDFKLPNIPTEEPAVTKRESTTTPRPITKSTTSKPIASTEPPTKPSSTTSRPTTVSPKPTVSNSHPHAAAQKPSTSAHKPPTPSHEPHVTATKPIADAPPKPPSPSPKPTPSPKPHAATPKPTAEAPNKPLTPSPKSSAQPPKPHTSTPKSTADADKPKIPVTTHKPSGASDKSTTPTPSVSPHSTSETSKPKISPKQDQVEINIPQEPKKSASPSTVPKSKEDPKSTNPQKILKTDSEKANIRSLKNEL
ncbi:hypothetical protein WA026_002459 [Henosepilachna vigintioctopunctata]|uniref:Strictosidine synthase conserved region domain-containing protein n=1 Tax=Henosepilachna vigintioctopunctata TaxID=420089 RepID=A0AAW1TUU0_9CUCU